MYEQPKRAKLVELLNDEMGILPGYEVIAYHYLTMLCEQTKETSTVVSRNTSTIENTSTPLFCDKLLQRVIYYSKVRPPY